MAFDLSISPDKEAIAFARELQSVLKRADWVQVAAPGPIILMGFSPQVGVVAAAGVSIEIAPSRHKLEGVAKVLVAALKGEKISAEWNIVPGVTADAIHIGVGTKPTS